MESITFGNYDVREDGEIYSHYSHRYLKHDISKLGYHQVTLFENGKPKRYKVHRLVGMLFLNCPNNYEELQINHKDGNKNNNHYLNLEWCTSYENNKHAREKGLNNVSKSNSERWHNKEWAIRTANKISHTKIAQGTHKHRKNGRFRYEIIGPNGEDYTRQDLLKLCGKGFSMSMIDRYIREAGQKNIYHPKLLELGIQINDTKRES